MTRIKHLVSRPGAPLLGALLLGLVALGAEPSTAQESAAPAPRVAWTPEEPTAGHLFRLRVSATEGSALVGVTGWAAGERLHFREVQRGVFEALAPAPIDVQGELPVRLSATSGGEKLSWREAVPLASGDYRHERLTVAPRFGSPPSAEDRERRAREAAQARGVSEAAHRTPRLWTSEVVLPRDDRVTSGFGNGREFNGQISSRHMGLDLDGETGDTVYAATRGVVELVDEFLLAGNIVYLNHGDGLVTGYFHLSEQLVTQGDTVRAGTPIGRVGATGRVTGPHLHWVVRYGYVSLDPRSLLRLFEPS